MTGRSQLNGRTSLRYVQREFNFEAYELLLRGREQALALTRGKEVGRRVTIMSHGHADRPHPALGQDLTPVKAINSKTLRPFVM